MFFFAGSFVALKIAFRYYDPMVVIFGRMAVASVCFLFFTGKFRKIDYRKGHWKYLVIMSLCEPCLYFVFEAKALAYTTASQAGMITSMLPLMVAVGAWVFLKERFTLKAVAGFLIAVSGACLLSVGAQVSQNAPHPVLGNFFEFLAMVAAAGYTIILKRLSSSYSPLFLTAVQAVTGAVFFGVLLFLPGVSLPSSFEPAGVAAIFYLGFVVTMIAYYLYNYGVSKINASHATAFINLIPVVTILLGWLILGEKFTLIQYVASVAVFIGIFLSQDRLTTT